MNISESSNIGWLSLIYNCAVLFLSEMFWMLPNIFSHKCPLKNLNQKLVKPLQIFDIFDVPTE